MIVDISHWNWATWTYAALMVVGLGMAISNHGKPRSNQDAGAAFIATILIIVLLGFGGFWNGPQ